MKARTTLPGNTGHHAIQVYAAHDTLGEPITDFLADGIAATQPTIVIAAAARCNLIVNALAGRRFDVASLLGARMLWFVGAEEMLATILVNGRPNAPRFKEVVGLALGRVTRPEGDEIVRVYSELVDPLWRRGHPDAALALEAMWNQVLKTHPVSLMCAYQLTSFLWHPAHDRVCACHTHVDIPAAI